ncbi:LCP family protein [Nakamurella sp.]|uniref:LCP family protein n=1 Tax=Nakamurella sp. TaxID=1869182 RepID=UPI003B3AF3AC
MAVALLAVMVLVVTGLEWTIKSRADSGILSRSVQAIVTDDPNLNTPTAVPTAPGSFTPENILLLGSDTRAGAANAAAGGTDASTSDGVANSDTLMIAHISSDRHVTVLSIPRDTMIDAPTCKIWDGATGELSDTTQPVSRGEKWHINSAYSVGGPQCTVRAVQDLTGLKMDRVIGIDFAGFQNMVDALGGITVNVCRPVVDGELGTVIPNGGVQTIQGDTALNLVRARKVEGDTDSDLARIRRQQIVLSAILQQVTSAGTLLNPGKLDGFLQAFVQNTFTANVTIDDLVALAQSMGNLDPSKVTFYTLPTVPSEYNPEALDPEQPAADEVFNALLNDQPLPGEGGGTAAATTPALPSPSGDAGAAAGGLATGTTVDPASIKLTVINVTGRSGVAGQAMDDLNAVGFDISDSDLQARPDEVQPDVTIEYDPTNLNAALTVAAAVPGATVVPVDGLGTSVRLLLGENYEGSVDAVSAGAKATATMGTATAPASSSAGSSDGSGGSGGTAATTALTSINAGEALCA